MKLQNWNKKIFDFEDFENICEKNNIFFNIEESKYKGEYLFIDNNPVILINEDAKKSEQLWIAFHELGHHFLHYPLPHRFSRGTSNKIDRQANFFAAIALMPTHLIKSMTLEEIVAEYGYPIKLIKIRKEIYEEYSI